MKMKQLEDKFFHRAIKGKKKISKVVIGFLKFQCSQIVHATHNMFYHYSFHRFIVSFISGACHEEQFNNAA